MNFKVEYIDFISRCPFKNCKNNQKTIRWFHDNCGGRLKLSTEGFIKCLKCQEYKSFMEWNINCGYNHAIKDLDAPQVCEWLRTFGNYAKIKEHQNIIAKIVMNVMMQISETNN